MQTVDWRWTIVIRVRKPWDLKVKNDPCSCYNATYATACKRSLEKIQDFKGIWINPWPRDMGAIL